MQFLQHLAEQRIAEAIERGELDDLPGQGLPLDLDEDALVAPELRLAYRILKNAGYVPPEVEALREIGALERLVSRGADEAIASRAARRLEVLWQRLGVHSPGARAALQEYRGCLLRRMSTVREPG